MNRIQLLEGTWSSSNNTIASPLILQARIFDRSLENPAALPYRNDVIRYLGT